MVYVAAVTPFLPDGQIDKIGVAKLMAWYKSNGCDGVVVGGTTGEGPSLSAVEKRDLIRLCCEHSMGLPQILGIATNSLGEAIWLSKQAADAGAEAAPGYATRVFSGLRTGRSCGVFLAILDASPIPVLVYNYPKRVNIEIAAETILRLAAHPNFLGVKDSSGAPENIEAFAAAAPGKRLGVGDETLLVRALEHGWTGTISGSANIVARFLKAVVDDWDKGQEAAEAKLELVKPALTALRTAPQPVTHKSILMELGVIGDSTTRIPLIEKSVDVKRSELAPVWALLDRPS